jgi:hypothetical protein
MKVEKFDPNPPSGEIGEPEYLEHPSEGFIPYDPNTLYIAPLKHRNPIILPGKFAGTKQPGVSTCSEPVQGNIGCAKWAGCPFKKYPYVGPGSVIMKHKATVSAAPCYHFYESTRNGRPTSQMHYGMNGWKLDTTRTTIDVLGSVPVTNPLGQTVSVKKGIWQMEIADLLPPWWPMMKAKGLPLPHGAELYPELSEGASKPRGRSSKPSA